MPNAILVGNEEVFKSLGIQNNQRIDIESLIRKLRAQFEREFYDTEDVGAEILQSLHAVKEGKVDNRPWKNVLNDI